MRFGIAVISGLVASGLVLAYGAYGPELRLSLPAARSSDALCAPLRTPSSQLIERGSLLPVKIRRTTPGLVLIAGDCTQCAANGMIRAVDESMGRSEIHFVAQRGTIRGPLRTGWASFTETDAHFPIPHLIRQSRSGVVIDVAYRAGDVRRFSE